jgi:bifunctional DNA-binding transcriptional regulator/antitoxin component of YhaV-PrlF toxin-antitoxin module
VAGVKKERRRGYTRLSAKRQVTVPLAVVREMGLETGDELKVEVDRVGRIVMTRSDGDVAERRRRALADAAGSMPGVWPAGELERMRDEWH